MGKRHNLPRIETNGMKTGGTERADATPMWDIMSPEDDNAMLEKFSAESNKVISRWSLGSASVVEKDAAVSFLVQLGAVQITIQPDSQQEASQKQVSIQFGDEQHTTTEQEHAKTNPVETKDAIPSTGNLVSSVSQDQGTRETSQAQINDVEEDDNNYSAWMTEPDDGEDDDEIQIPDTAPVVENTSATQQPREEHPCPDCHVVLHSTWDLDLHKLHECAKSTKPIKHVYNCDQCRKSFEKMLHAANHLRKVHNLAASEVTMKLAEMKDTERQKWREGGKERKRNITSSEKTKYSFQLSSKNLRSTKISDEEPKRISHKAPGLKGTKKDTQRQKVGRRKKGEFRDNQLVEKQKQSDKKRRIGRAGTQHSDKYVLRDSKRLCIRLQPLANGWIKILENETVDANQFISNSLSSKPNGTAVVSNVEMAKSMHTSDEHQNLYCNIENDNSSIVSKNEPVELLEGRGASVGMPIQGDVEKNGKKLTEMSNDLLDQVHTPEQAGEKTTENPIPKRKPEFIVETEGESSAAVPMSQIRKVEVEERSSELAVLKSDELQGRGCIAKQVGEENQGTSTDPLMDKERQRTDPEINESHDEQTCEPSELIEQNNLHDIADKRPKEMNSIDDSECKNNVTTRKSTEKGENAVLCPFCDLQFKTIYQRNQHMYKVHEEYNRKYKCSTCHKSFFQKAAFKTHIESHLDMSEREKYRCKICDKIYVSKYNYRDHMKLHIDTLEPFKCATCGKALATKSGLERHISSVHTKDVKFTCEVCGKKFYTTYKIKQHVETHKKERAFKCEECGKSFSYAFQLKTHQKNVHSNAGYCLCEICGSAFKCQGNLKQHHLTAHTDIYKYSCDICGKKFKRTSQHNAHRKIHSDNPNDRPFKCEICSKGFRSKIKLKVHMDWHFNIRSHTCDVCGKSFLTKGNLDKHQYVHQSKRPHECRICSRGFTDMPGLRKHLDVKHKITLKKVVTEGVHQATATKGSAADDSPAHKPASLPSNSESDNSDDDRSEFIGAGHQGRFNDGNVSQVSETSDGQVVREALLAMMNA